MPDTIHIQGLQTPVQIGVPDEERASWQTVEVDVTVTPKADFRGLEDDIVRTIDYARLSAAIRELAAQRPRKLIETLADELAMHLLEEFPMREVRLAIRKFVLPGARWVAVSVTRSASA